jgi:hypothetical protein
MINCGPIKFQDPCGEYNSSKYFRVKNICVKNNPQFEIADPYSFSPRYVGGGFEVCEVTIECENPIVLDSLLKYLQTYNGDSDYSKTIDSIKHDCEEKINSLTEKYNALLAEVMKSKLTPKYKLKHRIKYIKL